MPPHISKAEMQAHRENGRLLVAAKALNPQLWMLAVQRRSELHKAELQAHRQNGWLLVAVKTDIEPSMENACSPTETQVTLKKLSTCSSSL